MIPQASQPADALPCSSAVCRTDLRAAAFTTYRIGGLIAAAYLPDTLEQAVAVLEQADRDSQPCHVLGWGSNSIVASAGLTGLTLITRRLTGIRRVDDTCWELEAGVHAARVAKLACDHGLSGAEYLIGIPATVGGAVRMNAGALGQDTAALVESIRLYNRENHQVETWPAERLGYGYRASSLDPELHRVLSARFRFTPGDTEAITAKMEGSVQFRKAHHPTEPNGGSVFQNPDPVQTAGRLLDELGAKTWQEGEAAVSPRHANFIINLGQATSLDVLRLMSRMQDAVHQHYRMLMHPENKLLGDITAEERDLWHKLTRS